jgi:hypothetical protein
LTFGTAWTTICGMSTSDSPAAASTAAPRALPWIMWGLGALFYCYGFFQRTAPSVMVD